MPFGATATASGVVPAGIVTVENAALKGATASPRTAATSDPPAVAGRTPPATAGAPHQPVIGSMTNLSQLRGPPKNSHRGPRRTAPVYANRITACTPGQQEGTPTCTTHPRTTGGCPSLPGEMGNPPENGPHH
ncbi:hypothetical protein Srufu_013860 [Streptomyces libani subsp. rufus]|nr:hypothetical protein Srufu_013860 [Streptomyces libani subsp. rufus]